MTIYNNRHALTIGNAYTSSTRISGTRDFVGRVPGVSRRFTTFCNSVSCILKKHVLCNYLSNRILFFFLSDSQGWRLQFIFLYLTYINNDKVKKKCILWDGHFFKFILFFLDILIWRFQFFIFIDLIVFDYFSLEKLKKNLKNHYF